MACGGLAGFFLHYGVIHAAAAGPPQRKVGVVCIPANFVVVVVTLDSYQQLLKFSRAGNCDEEQLRKTELKLHAVAIGTVFRLSLIHI